MEVIELRINNYIKDEDGNISKIKAIDSEKTFFQQSINKTWKGVVIVENELIGKWIEKCSRVAIDEEWLKKINLVSVGGDFVRLSQSVTRPNIKRQARKTNKKENLETH